MMCDRPIHDSLIKSLLGNEEGSKAVGDFQHIQFPIKGSLLHLATPPNAVYIKHIRNYGYGLCIIKSHRNPQIVLIRDVVIK